MNENNENEDENEEDEDENISIDFSENFSMIKEAFTEIEDCNYYSWIYFNEDKKNENFLKKRKTI